MGTATRASSVSFRQSATGARNRGVAAARGPAREEAHGDQAALNLQVDGRSPETEESQ